MSESNTTQPKSTQQEEKLYTVAEFLENIPPGKNVKIENLSIKKLNIFILNAQDIHIHCANDACNGFRFFRCPTEGQVLEDDLWQYFYMRYFCSNCQKHTKVYAVAICKNLKLNTGIGYKFGEFPAFGSPVSPKLIKLIGPDRETFLQGRRCENQGLGIGAFVYYRRVVENQKNRIISEIIKVARKIGSSESVIAELDDAIKETRFSESLKSVKQGLPQSLLIDGHNPLTLLHSALSEGIHTQSDQECLEIASAVRLVLIELADRLSQALKDDAEINHAVAKLLAKKSERG